MELDIVKTKEILPLSRKRITCISTFEKETPSRVVINEKIAAKLGVSPNLVVTRHIYNKFGERSAKIIAHVYSNLEDLKINEDENLVKKNKKDNAEKAVKENKGE
jgi:ribosomal protein S24E